MIRAIIFDLGNVLCTFTNEVFLSRISKISGKSISDLRDILYVKSDLLKKNESGAYSSQEFYKSLSILTGVQLSYNELKALYSGDKFIAIPGMRDLISLLMKKYRIALLSNTSEWDFEYARVLIPEIETIDVVSLSYEIKAMKPLEKIYRETLQILDLPPEECVYIDDILKYVDVARSLGMKGIQFKGKEDLLKSLNLLGIDL